MPGPDPHRTDIDGLRAIAVGSVLLFHFGLGLPGGFVGVDVFFVISGYLITGIVHREATAGTFRLGRFYERRIRRIVPACAAMVLATLAVGWFLLQRRDLADLGRSGVAQALLASNFLFARATGYFDPAAELKPLLHTWSLAVEEQFYLAYPLALAAMTARRPGILGRAGTIAAAASLAVAAAMAWHAPEPGFYWPFGRAWEFLAGGLLAVGGLGRGWGTRARHAASLAGLALIAAACSVRAGTAPGRLALEAAACAGAVLVIAAGSGSGAGAGSRFLSIAPMRWVGLASYSLYLVHWPIAAYVRYAWTSEPGTALGLASLAASVALGALSWRFVERPFRHGLGAGSARATWTLFAAATALVLAASLALVVGRGFPARAVAEAAGRAHAGVPRTFATESVQDAAAGRLPRLGACTADRPRADFVLWGDSHAMAFADVVDEEARSLGLCGIAALRPATAPVLGTWRPAKGSEQREWNDAVWASVRGSGARHLVLAARWSINVDGREDGATDALVGDGVDAEVSPATARAALARGLARTVEAAEAAGMETWILLDVPLRTRTPEQSAVRRAWGIAEDAALPTAEEHAVRDRVMHGIVAGVARGHRVHVVDLADPVLADAARAVDGDWVDRDHLSPQGARRLLGPTIARMLAAMARGAK